MKTPDEIKKALECCFYESAQCGECPYYPVSCDRELVRDAREYIRQLEGCLDKEREQNRFLWDKNKQLEAERDALISDFEQYDELPCALCEHYSKGNDEIPCKFCKNLATPTDEDKVSQWQWRGVTKEE